MRCRGCGNALPDGAKFCNGCGARLAPRSSRRVGLAIFAVLVIGGGVGTGVWMARRTTAPSTATGEPGASAASAAFAASGRPAGPDNLPPHLASFTARDRRIAIGASTELTAVISDPDRDAYYAWWSASCGVVAPRAGAPGHALFFAPDTAGPCTITIDVRDHEMLRAQRFHYTIVAEAR